MKRCKKLIEVMCMSIIFSGIIILICESSRFSYIRDFIKQNIIFFDGKKNVIENICIGIFASSLISLIGYIHEYRNEERNLKLEVIRIFKIIYFKYYELIGDKNIKDIRDMFLKDEIINKISYCDIEYKKFFSKKDDIYIIAIDIMKWTELYYTNVFCIYAALCEIEKCIDSVKESMEDISTWEEKDLVDKFLYENKEVLSKLQKDYDDILEEMNKRINYYLKIKRELDYDKMVQIKNRFGILDGIEAAFLGNINYIEEVWKNIEK